MSIATKHGDRGQTALIGGERVSKADLRVEAYGTIDELGATLGFARSICDDAEVRELTKEIQRELFTVSGAVANPRASQKPGAYVTVEIVERLTAHVNRIEAMEGILSDWALPGEHAAASAFDVARTVCRRAERAVVRLSESNEEAAPNKREEVAPSRAGGGAPEAAEKAAPEAAERVAPEAAERVAPEVVAYLNRLSDLLWLFGRLLELRAGINSRMRDEGHEGPRWSRAW